MKNVIPLVNTNNKVWLHAFKSLCLGSTEVNVDKRFLITHILHRKLGFEFDDKFQIPYFPHHLGMNYYVNFLGHLPYFLL